MPMISAQVIELSETERVELARRARRVRTEVRDAIRARIILAAARGTPNQQIAERVGVHVDTVRKWRSRFARRGLDGLGDLPRTGRPRMFANAAVAEVKALACQLPAETGVPLSRWSHAELAVEAVNRRIVESVSSSTVRRWLDADAIKPWQHRSWIFPRDPDFAFKAGRVLDLYGRVWDGKPLGADEYVISADEKSQLQALHRRHPGLPPAPGRARRVEFEYRRGGTLAYLAAYDVHHARDRKMRAHHRDRTLHRTRPASHDPTRYASARRVFWVVDNGSSHAGAASVQRMKNAFPNAALVHLPVHASWLNQVEIYFSIVQRKVVKPQDFENLTVLEHRLLAFQHRYNTTAIPFDWRFGRTALHNLLQRVSRHETTATPPPTN